MIQRLKELASGKELFVLGTLDGKQKPSDRWENNPYVVLDQPNPEISVFTVRKESGEGRKKNLHRNLLLPVGKCESQRDQYPNYDNM